MDGRCGAACEMHFVSLPCTTPAVQNTHCAWQSVTQAGIMHAMRFKTPRCRRCMHVLTACPDCANWPLLAARMYDHHSNLLTYFREMLNATLEEPLEWWGMNGLHRQGLHSAWWLRCALASSYGGAQRAAAVQTAACLHTVLLYATPTLCAAACVYTHARHAYYQVQHAKARAFCQKARSATFRLPCAGYRLEAQEAWVNQQVAANPEDPYWRLLGLINTQFDGLVAGYQAAAREDQQRRQALRGRQGQGQEGRLGGRARRLAGAGEGERQGAVGGGGVRGAQEGGAGGGAEEVRVGWLERRDLMFLNSNGGLPDGGTMTCWRDACRGQGHKKCCDGGTGFSCQRWFAGRMPARRRGTKVVASGESYTGVLALWRDALCKQRPRTRGASCWAARQHRTLR